MTSLLSPTDLPDAPRLAVVPHDTLPFVWWVKGTQTVYRVTLSPPACECASHHFRHRCAHVNAVLRYLWLARVCPVCRGKGWLAAHPGSGMRYVRRDAFDVGPWPLACCNGTGLRSEHERQGGSWLEGEWGELYCPTPAQPEPGEEG